jgi:TonB family protein
MIERACVIANALIGVLPSVCLLASPSTLAAQTPSSNLPSNPVVLNSKEASRLILNQMKPEYPALAKVNYIQGSVRMRLRITREGRVSEAHVIRGHPFLAAEALNAARHWIYRMPKNGTAKDGFLTFVDINFKLRQRHVERLPPQPELDLDRQVQPPTVVQKPDCAGALTTSRMRVRVLVGPDGRALDAEPASGENPDLRAARKVMEQWRFHPARWGNHAVPWYLDVDVPALPSETAPAVRPGTAPLGARRRDFASTA